MGTEFENLKIERDDTDRLITDHANAVIAEIFERAEKGPPPASLETLARLRFTEQERAYKQTDSLVREIVIQVHEIARDNPELKAALRIVTPAHDIGKREEQSPDFDPLGLNKKE